MRHKSTSISVSSKLSTGRAFAVMLVLACGSGFAQDYGLHHEWTRQYGGTTMDSISYLHVFPDNTYLTGGSFSDWFDPLHPELNPEPWSSYRNGLFGRFSADGEILWLKPFVGNPTVRFLKVLDGERFIMCGNIHATTTFGYGEPNETVLPRHPTDGDAAFYVASYNADGTLAWARRFISPTTEDRTAVFICDGAHDGGCYVITSTCGDHELVFDDGPVFTEAVVLARYSAEGNLDWTRVLQNPFAPLTVMSLPDSYVLAVTHSDYVEITRYSEAGQPIWSEQLPKPLSACSFFPVAIPGTSDFYFYLRNYDDDFVTVYRYNTEPGGGVTRAWATQFSGQGWSEHVLKHDRSLYLYNNYDPEMPVCISPDGQVSAETRVMFPLLPPEPYGSRIIRQIGFTANDAGLMVVSHITSRLLCPIPVFGEGQDTETSFTVSGTSDAAISKYQFVPRHTVQPQTEGEGFITLDPPGNKYTQGTLVTVRAQPTWPDHDQFVRWEGDLAAYTDPEVTFTLNGAMSFSAIFEPLPGVPPLPAASLAGVAVLAAALAGLVVCRKK